MALFDTILGGAFDWMAADKASDAQQESARLDREAADRRANLLIDQSKLSRPSESAFGTVTEEGLLTQPGAPAAATARSNLATGDIGRAGQINALTAAGPNFQLPTLADAQAIIAKDTARQRETVVDPALRNFAIQANRANRDNNPALLGQYAKNLQDLQGSLRLDEGTGALNLFNKQRQSDIANLSNEMGLYGLQAPAPGFASSTEASNAQNVLAQSPIGANVPDVGGVAFPAAASNAIAQFQQQQSQQESNRLIMALLERQLGNQGALAGTWPPSRTWNDPG